MFIHHIVVFDQVLEYQNYVLLLFCACSIDFDTIPLSIGISGTPVDHKSLHTIRAENAHQVVLYGDKELT
jgi:hypothetical protein